MKKNIDIARSIIKKVSDDDLNFLHSRLKDRFSGDIPAVLEYAQSNDLDRYFGNAKTANELFDYIDDLTQAVESEVSRRAKTVTSTT